MEKIRVFTAFSGYDSQCLSLDRLKKKYPEFDYELVGWSEIDKYAIQAHNAIYPQWADRNLGDISKINWDEVPDFDLFTYSSPCQDFSNAGLQRGGEEGSGTRSSLLWECRRAIVAKKPKFLLMENVAALVSQKFIKTFNKWQEELARYGYTNFAQVLNAKDYGIPQNRERIFLVSVLGEAWYNFPQPFKLEKRLKDVLETNVDEKYYLSEKAISGFENRAQIAKKKGNGFGWNPTDGSTCAYALKASAQNRADDNFVKVEGSVSNSQNGRVINPDCISYAITNAEADGDSINLEQPNSKTRRGRVGKQMANTLTTSCNQGVVVSEPKAVSYTRDSKGKTQNKHLNEIVNTIHSSTGSGGNTDCFVAEPQVQQIDNLVVEPLNPYKDGTCRTIKAQYQQSSRANFVRQDGLGATGVVQNRYRIRKLTPRECFRLMDVDDNVIDTIQAAGISNSQQYKLAGNSIVVACLEKIFEQMFFPQYTNSRTLFG